MKKNLILLICLFISTVASAGPGLKMVAMSKTSSSDVAAQTTIYINASQMVLQTQQNGDFTMMFDAEKEEIVIVDNRKKQYSKLGKKELTDLSEQLNSMKGFLKAFYKNMPPETQKKFAPLVNGKDPNITFSSQGSSTVSKWKTTKYNVSGGDQKKLFDIDIADFSSIGIKQGDVAAVKKLSLMLDKYLSGIEAFIPGASIFSNLNSDKNPMFTKGVPVKTVSFEDNGKSGDEFIVTSAEKTTFSLADFKIPAGYEQKNIALENPMGK